MRLSISSLVLLSLTIGIVLTGCGGGGGDAAAPVADPGTGTGTGGGTTSAGLADLEDLGQVISAKATGTAVKVYNLGTTTTPTVDDHSFMIELTNDANPMSPVPTTAWPYSTTYSIEAYVNGTLRALFGSMTNFDERNPYTGVRYRYLLFTDCTFNLTAAEAASLPKITLKLVNATPNTSIQVRSSFNTGPVLVPPVAVDSTGKVQLTFPTQIQIMPANSG